MSCAVVNFYRFQALNDPAETRKRWRQSAQECGLLGTVLVAPEGVNCALAGEQALLERFVSFAQDDLGVESLGAKWSHTSHVPFKKLKVKLKRWIIRFAEGDDPSIEAIAQGPRWTPAQVDEALEKSRNDLVIVDTRNSYETDVGAFQGAVQLPIRTFTEFPEVFLSRFSRDKDKTFLFYCTGGVRCEKVVPWAIAHGFKNSTQLEGGILKYFEEVGSKHYDRECFVFDERILLGSDLTSPAG